MQINMLGVLTDRLAEMKEFYSSVLGFEIAQELESYVEFSGQPVRFAICERKIMQQVTGDPVYDQRATGAPLELAFKCDSREQLDADYQELIAKGAKAVKPPAAMPWGQYAGFFADPDGHVHELFVDEEIS